MLQERKELTLRILNLISLIVYSILIALVIFFIFRITNNETPATVHEGVHIFLDHNGSEYFPNVARVWNVDPFFIQIILALSLFTNAVTAFLLSFPLFDSYITHISEGYNEYRWIEYSISLSKIGYLAGVIAGVMDFKEWIMIPALITLFCFVGYILDIVVKDYRKANENPSSKKIVQALLFSSFYIIALIIGSIIYSFVIRYMNVNSIGNDSIKWWIWTAMLVFCVCLFAYWILLFLYSNMQIDYFWIEIAHILISWVLRITFTLATTLGFQYHIKD